MAERDSKQGSWLGSWLAEHDVSNVDQFDRAVQHSGSRAELSELVNDFDLRVPEPGAPEARGLAAGAELDLSGYFGCTSEACLKRKIDTVFQKAWHYFDTIYVVGPSQFAFAGMERSSSEVFLRNARRYVSLMDYINRSGASEYIVFREKYYPKLVGDEVEYDLRYIRDEEFEALERSRFDWVHAFMDSDLRTEIQKRDNGRNLVEVSHPRLPMAFAFEFERPDEPVTDLDYAHNALEANFDKYTRPMLADINFARTCGAPLGSASGAFEHMLESIRDPQALEAEVAFNLPLPFVENLSMRDLVKLKEGDAESFDVFREALRKAITERVKTSQEADATAIAVEICEDVIAPALADIDNKLATATKTLARGSGAALVAASVPTTVGLLGGFSAVAGTLLGALTALPDVRTYLNSKSEIERSEMYFLWNTTQKALHGGDY